MSEIKAIKTNKDYEAALQRLEKIFEPVAGSKEENEAEVLVILIEDYEKKNFPIDAPSPVEAIKFRMEQQNLKQVDLVKYLGSESRVSEVLKGKRSLTVEMIAALHKGLDIPLESLVSGKMGYTQKQRLPLASETNVQYAKKKRK